MLPARCVKRIGAYQGQRNVSPRKIPEPRGYDVVAPAYDLLADGYDHRAWLLAIERLAREHGLAGRRALDVACGTGRSLAALLAMGFDGMGCDASLGMVAVARTKLGADICIEVADMRELPTYGSFDLITCLDDAVNHLTSPHEVTRTLAAMGRNLAPHGLLAFDVNTLAAYRRPADRVVADDRRLVLWHGAPARMHTPGGCARVTMDVLRRDLHNRWDGMRTSWSHRHYPLSSIPALVKSAGLAVKAIRGQSRGGRLEPRASENRYPKALVLVGRDSSPNREEVDMTWEP